MLTIAPKLSQKLPRRKIVFCCICSLLICTKHNLRILNSPSAYCKFLAGIVSLPLLLLHLLFSPKSTSPMIVARCTARQDVRSGRRPLSKFDCYGSFCLQEEKHVLLWGSTTKYETANIQKLNLQDRSTCLKVRKQKQRLRENTMRLQGCEDTPPHPPLVFSTFRCAAGSSQLLGHCLPFFQVAKG